MPFTHKTWKVNNVGNSLIQFNSWFLSESYNFTFELCNMVYIVTKNYDSFGVHDTCKYSYKLLCDYCIGVVLNLCIIIAANSYEIFLFTASNFK